MRLFVLVLLLSPLRTTAAAPAWEGPWRGGIPQLVTLLEQVPEGKKLVARAERKDPDFRQHLHVGKASYTESTFARTYSLVDGGDRVELRHEITLNGALSLAEAVVDLAHELVHFTEKLLLDPYRPGFDLEQFVKSGIEGEGGELIALQRECEVAWALQKKFAAYPEHTLCARYRDKKGAFAVARARQDYYALGKWWKQAPAGLLRAVKEVSAEPVVFTSSFAGKPYPVALAEEFVATRKVACANNQRKYRLIAAQAGTGRAPASNLLLEEKRRLRDFNQQYCDQETDL